MPIRNRLNSWARLAPPHQTLVLFALTKNVDAGFLPSSTTQSQPSPRTFRSQHVLLPLHIKDRLASILLGPTRQSWAAYSPASGLHLLRRLHIHPSQLLPQRRKLHLILVSSLPFLPVRLLMRTVFNLHRMLSARSRYPRPFQVFPRPMYCQPPSMPPSSLPNLPPCLASVLESPCCKAS